jgi:hypothetical protein
MARHEKLRRDFPKNRGCFRPGYDSLRSCASISAEDRGGRPSFQRPLGEISSANGPLEGDPRVRVRGIIG